MQTQNVIQAQIDSESPRHNYQKPEYWRVYYHAWWYTTAQTAQYVQAWLQDEITYLALKIAIDPYHDNMTVG